LALVWGSWSSTLWLVGHQLRLNFQGFSHSHRFFTPHFNIAFIRQKERTLFFFSRFSSSFFLPLVSRKGSKKEQVYISDSSPMSRISAPEEKTPKLSSSAASEGSSNTCIMHAWARTME